MNKKLLVIIVCLICINAMCTKKGPQQNLMDQFKSIVLQIEAAPALQVTKAAGTIMLTGGAEGPCEQFYVLTDSVKEKNDSILFRYNKMGWDQGGFSDNCKGKEVKQVYECAIPGLDIMNTRAGAVLQKKSTCTLISSKDLKAK